MKVHFHKITILMILISSLLSVLFIGTSYQPLQAAAEDELTSSPYAWFDQFDDPVSWDDPSQPFTYTDDSGTTISFPSDSLVYEDGTPVTTPVLYYQHTVDVTQVDIGDMTGLDENGQLVALESVSTINMRATDLNGRPLFFAPDRFAQLSVPVSSAFSTLSTVPLWEFDVRGNIWIQNGVATQQNGVATQQNGTFQGSIAEFGSWNFDVKVPDPACIHLIVNPDLLMENNPLLVKAVLRSPRRVRDLRLTLEHNVLYNLPPDTLVDFYMPPEAETPFATISSGAPWGGVGKPADASLCNGRLQIGDPQEPKTVAIIGDYGVDNAQEAAVADLVHSWNPDAVATVGDNIYGNRTFDTAVGNYYCAFLANVTPDNAIPHCDGGDSSINRFFPSPGNYDHDEGPTNNLNDYLTYFDLPGADIQSSNTSNSERYYDFRQGNVHFFILDSETIHNTGGIGGAEYDAQRAWLQVQLAASSARWKLVLMHHPPFSSSTHGSHNFMQWPFAEWGADAIIAGHDHTYERIHRDGIVYFVNGLGGSAPREFGTPVTGSVVRYNDDNGAMRVLADNNELILEFVSVAGVVIDESCLSNTVCIDPLSDESEVTQLAQSLVGEGVAVSNVTYTGVLGALGRFTNGAEIVGFESGVIMSSGFITDVVGPNDATRWSGQHTTNIRGVSLNRNDCNNLPNGDDTLNELVPEGETCDAIVLEFDFIPDDDQVYFQYVFASEEYNEFVGSHFNDVFGFFINQTEQDIGNCAVVGDLNDPVSINSINNGKNIPLYRDNTDGDTNIEADGLTVVLTCRADVNPNVSNHVKLALADTSDDILDSWVFIRQNSITTVPPLIVTKVAFPTVVTPAGIGNYAITVSNPNDESAEIIAIEDTLPIGFTYIANSTSGATNNNPMLSGQTLTWDTPISVPANGSVTLNFEVTVPITIGQYFNNATAYSNNWSVVPTGETAPILVSDSLCSTTTEIPPSECLALVALHNSTNGDGWYNDNNWLETDTPCSWFGVTCTSGHVTRLAFRSNGLHGAIPPQISDLPALEFMQLNFNRLTSVPVEIGQLSALHTLVLNGNQLTELPTQIGDLPALKYLYLDNNQLTELPSEIGNLTLLQNLFVSYNQLTELPPEIGNLTSLQLFPVSYNELTALPPEIGNLSRLRNFYVTGNQLTDLPTEIGNLVNLQKLDVGDNQLTTFPTAISNLSSLKWLYLHKNQLSALPSTIGALHSLEWLYVYENQLTTLPPEIGNLTTLQGLYLYDNQLTELPAEIGNLTTLDYFLVNDNPMLTGAIPETLSNIPAGGGALRYFYFHNTALCEPQDNDFQNWLQSITYVQSTNIACPPPSFPVWQPIADGFLATAVAWNYAMSYHFTPQTDGSITQTVRLFESATGELLAEAIVSCANEWCYGSIDSVAVEADKRYTVAVYLAGSGGSYRYNIIQLPRLSGDIRIDGTTWAYMGSDPDARPTNIYPYHMYGQADIQFVPADNDDVEEAISDGEMFLDSSDLELGIDATHLGEQTVGLRFRHVSIPTGATIERAYLEFTVDEVTNELTTVQISGSAEDTLPFTTNPYDLTDRTLTNASTTWSIPTWDTIGARQQSPDLTAIVQEMIDHPNWQAYNSLVFAISGSGQRTAVSFDGNANQAATLHIHYSTPSSYTFALSAGWNLLSLPRQPAENDVESIFAEIAEQVLSVVAYEACDNSDPWKIHNPSATFSNDLTHINADMGVWIRLSEPAILTVAGDTPSVEEIPMCEGWNLVGYPVGEVLPTVDGMALLTSQNYTAVQTYEQGWLTYNPGATFSNALTELQPSYGLWILIDP